jgi:hypothetical protein
MISTNFNTRTELSHIVYNTIINWPARLLRNEVEFIILLKLDYGKRD